NFPTNNTAILDKNIVDNKLVYRTTLLFSPNLFDSVSPRLSIVNCLLIITKTIKITRTIGVEIASCFQFVPLTPPTLQNVKVWFNLNINAIPSLAAVNNADTAAPANTNLIGLKPPRLEEPTLMTRIPPIPAPINPANIRVK